MKNTTTNEVTCGKCNGKGKLGWTRNEGGKCFACGGSGVLVVTEAAITEAKLPRAEAIAKIKACLDRYAATDASDEAYALSWLIVRADADVAARAVAAFGRLGGVESNLMRQVAHDRSKLGTRLVSVAIKA